MRARSPGAGLTAGLARGAGRAQGGRQGGGRRGHGRRVTARAPVARQSLGGAGRRTVDSCRGLGHGHVARRVHAQAASTPRVSVVLCGRSPSPSPQPVRRLVLSVSIQSAREADLAIVGLDSYDVKVKAPRKAVVRNFFATFVGGCGQEAGGE